MGISMSRIVYVNGEYLPEEDAKISVFDRGFLMADAVYEVTSVIDGKILAFDGHIERLERSLSELDMKAPCTIPELLDIHRELIKRNNVVEGLVYLQVTRGIADRDFAYPDVAPSLVLFTQTKNVVNSPMAKTGMKVISIPDIRWGRRDIKTVQLLAPSMGKMAAKAAGCDDAWLVEDGFVTEGTSNNAYIVTQDGTIITRNLGTEILAGITRAAVLRFAAEAQIKIEERPFTIEEAKRAKEAFVTSATTFVGPVIEIDGVQIGDGKVGDIARRLREIYLQESLKTAI